MTNPLNLLKLNKLTFFILFSLILVSGCVSRREYLELKRELAEIKSRPIYDLTDTDGDGVIDMIDQEKDTPAGARVDTRGVALDSDSDGVPDYKDREPYSPIGYKVDKTGVAMVPKPFYTTESDVDRITDAKLAKLKEAMGGQKTSGSVGLSFFKTITYAKSKTEFSDSDDALSILAEVSHIMKDNPSITLLVCGFATDSGNEKEDNYLSYKRAATAIELLESIFGMDRQRLVLNYAGQNRTLNTKNIKAKINFRIEISIATGESEMAEPKRN